MVKNALLSVLLSIGINLLFYLIDNMPKDNGGNWIMFTFLSICFTYLMLVLSIILTGLYVFKIYSNRFLTTFIPTYILVSTAVILIEPLYPSLQSFMVSQYTHIDLLSFTIMIGVLIFQRRARQTVRRAN
jgi:hypothetical protein